MTRVLKAADLDAPVSSHMREDITRLTLGQTVGETLEHLRRNPPAERIMYLYVVDGGGRLAGVVPTRQLLLTPLERPIDDIMTKRVVSLRGGSTVRDACELFALHRFLALPVIDGQGVLRGVVDIELYTDEVGELNDSEKLADLFQAIGVYAGGQGDASTWRVFSRRFPWLACNLVGGFLCALMANNFRAELQRVVALSLFIPVVLNLAESVSSQSVSLTLHALHGQAPTWRFMLRGLRQELTTGLLLGIACGICVSVASIVWLRHTRVALCLLGGIAGGVILSAVLGLALPIALRLLKLDPKVAAGPIALAAADVGTLLIYLGLARWVLS